LLVDTSLTLGSQDPSAAEELCQGVGAACPGHADSGVVKNSLHGQLSSRGVLLPASHICLQTNVLVHSKWWSDYSIWELIL